MRPRELKLRRPKAPKAVSYVFIPPDSDVGKPMYERLYNLVDEHHLELAKANARIALAWATAWRPDADGRVTLGKCRKTTELDRELAPYDFVVLLNREFWQNLKVSDDQRKALMDHELCHATVAFDENGEMKRDDRGRVVFRSRKHDLEEFEEIAARYGCWKRDIESFARALARADRDSSRWVSYSAVAGALKLVGIDVARDVIATWDTSERQEVLAWARIRQDTGDARLDERMPARLAEALAPPPAEVLEHAASASERTH